MEGFGFVAFEKLKYQTRFKVVEASAVKQPRPQSNFKTVVKRCAGYEDDIKGLQSQLFMHIRVVTCNYMELKEII